MFGVNHFLGTQCPAAAGEVLVESPTSAMDTLSFTRKSGISSETEVLCKDECFTDSGIEVEEGKLGLIGRFEGAAGSKSGEGQGFPAPLCTSFRCPHGMGHLRCPRTRSIPNSITESEMMDIAVQVETEVGEQRRMEEGNERGRRVRNWQQWEDTRRSLVSRIRARVRHAGVPGQARSPSTSTPGETVDLALAVSYVPVVASWIGVG